MLRCPAGAAGRFEVRVEYLDIYGDTDPAERNLDIGPHIEVQDANGKVLEDQPYASQAVPYVGELCEHEVTWCQMLPGKAFSAHRRYYLKEL